MGSRAVQGSGALKSRFRFLGQRQKPNCVFQRAATRLGQDDVPENRHRSKRVTPDWLSKPLMCTVTVAWL